MADVTGQAYIAPSDDTESNSSAPDPSPRDIFQYITYKPRGTARAWSGRKIIYDWPGIEAMSACIDRYLESITWVQIVLWNNKTSSQQTCEISYRPSLKITSGSEINVGFDLGTSYEGMSIVVDMSVKTFTSVETVAPKTTTITVNVAPNSMVVFYQKRYNFRDSTTFISNSWGKDWNTGPWGGYSPLITKTSYVQIDADEYLANNAPLKAGTGLVQCTSVSQAQKAGLTRKREDLTDPCKDKLSAMGL
ncbi:hypothetical protein BJ165DRAFT_1467628 [Panaeolus papilionaceus]|nr:hypothetical protein BJ165DRAFT_1467628 [Panaeolus papilionaceus]